MGIHFAARDHLYSMLCSTLVSTPLGRTSPIKVGSGGVRGSGSGGGAGGGGGGTGCTAWVLFAGLLLPKRVLCYLKFALAVDDLFFVGHPVCADDDVLSSTKFNLPVVQEGNGSSLVLPPLLSLLPPPMLLPSWLQTFHIAFVYEVPDLSSQTSAVVLYNVHYPIWCSNKSDCQG